MQWNDIVQSRHIICENVLKTEQRNFARLYNIVFTLISLRMVKFL